MGNQGKLNKIKVNLRKPLKLNKIKENHGKLGKTMENQGKINEN